MAKQRFGINDAYRGTVGTVIGYEWRGKWCLRARPLHVHNPRTAKQQSNRMLFKQMVELAGHMKVALRKGLRGVSLGMHVTECNLFVKRNKECFELDGEQRMVVDWEGLIVSEGSVAVPVFEEPDYPHPALQAPLPQGGDARSEPSGAQKHTPSPLRGTPPSLGGERLPQSGLTSSSPKLGEGNRRVAVVEECVKDGGVRATIVFPFAPHAEGERASGDDEVYVYAYCPEMEEGVLSASTYRRTKNVTITLPDRWQGKEVHFYGFAVDYEGNASATTYLGLLEATPVETQRTVYRKSENSHCFVEKNLWHGSCNQNISSTFASRNLVTKWKQT